MSWKTREYQSYWPTLWEIYADWGYTELKPLALCEYPVENTPTLRDPSPDTDCEEPAVARVLWHVEHGGEWNDADMMVCQEHADLVKRQEENALAAVDRPQEGTDGEDA